MNTITARPCALAVERRSMQIYDMSSPNERNRTEHASTSFWISTMSVPGMLTDSPCGAVARVRSAGGQASRLNHTHARLPTEVVQSHWGICR